MQRMRDPKYLPTISMAELYDTVYQSRPPIIGGLLHTGTYLLAGPPKVGKSFLVAQMAYHVSTGQPLWEFPVEQGTVLYLALEDDYQRLQNRMFRMFGVEDPGDLYFCVSAKQLGNGLEEQLERFIQEHPGTRLIIIDTLQKVRENRGEAYNYASDYEIVGRFKQFADRHDIAVLIVHHTRKQPAGDAFEMISGTNGLLGCADGAFVLQKEDRLTRLACMEVVGRDQGDQRLYLRRDPEKLTWELDHAESAGEKLPCDPILEAVSVLVDDEWLGTPALLAEAIETEMKPNHLTKHLNVSAARLLKEYGVRYESFRHHEGRRVRFTRIKPRRVDGDGGVDENDAPKITDTIDTTDTGR